MSRILNLVKNLDFGLFQRFNTEHLEMSVFKFCFQVDETVDADKYVKAEIEWKEASEIEPSSTLIQSVDEIYPKANMYLCGDLEIGHVSPEDAVKYLMDTDEDNELNSDVLLAECQHSDLLIGKYEGGLKIWECTNDLTNFLNDEKIAWEGTNVLDLGCGAGILGLVPFLSGATNVHFQDYNKEVLQAVTIPNCLLNIPEEERQSIHSKCKFYSGDWASWSKLMLTNETEHKYDFILSSETIYNEDNQEKIFNIIKNHLKPNGVVYLAAKTYYFGVGGSLRQFESLINKSDSLKSEICWTSTGGVKREIIKITFK